MMNRLMTIYLSFMFILAMNMTSVLSVKAENYPYRSDYLWLTVPDMPTGSIAQESRPWWK